MASTPIRRGAAVLLCAAALLSGCGKTITITDSDSKQQPAATTAATSAPAASSAPAPAGGGNGQLEVVDSTAAQNGKTGNGGTVIGVAIQESPPVWVQLAAVTSPPLNKPHLININQAALYRFDKDTAKPSKSNCNDDCAAKWPPVTIQEGGAVYLAGVDPKQVGAIRREDGTVQITVGGWPAYRFAKDKLPGDLNGQGVGGTWFALGPDGKQVVAAK
ncbi:hypothetical protein [Actinoplanes sp. L3-i22]|uniref:hypothetical protein n=1 Tax=Actinoplanes sp. L3-i22 TaxID=2836373 RepID=UPI001C85803D|nr:hypothetical protein [Actinoplanes sp. L3-i22]